MDLKQKNTRFLFPVFVFVFLIIFAVNLLVVDSDLSPIGFAHLKSHNFMSKLTIKNNVPSDDVVLVVIDDQSLSQIGRWPWKRDYYLEIFDYIENYTNAKSMGYDALIMMPDKEHPQSDKRFFSQIGKFKKLTAGVTFSYNDFEDGVDVEKYDNLLRKKQNINVIDKRSKNKEISSFKSFTKLQYEYFKNIYSLGTIGVIVDSDGYVRTAFPLVDYKGSFFPSLALSIYSEYTGIKDFTLTDKYLLGSSDNYSLKVPVNIGSGFVQNYICYYKSDDNTYSHKKYSASDIIYSYRALKQGKKPIIDSSEFDNKAVFIGALARAQALKALEDIVRTPIAEEFSGLDIQATNFDNLLTNNFYRVLGPLFNFIICVLISLIVFFFVNSMPISISLISSVLVGFLYFGFACLMYYNKISVDLFLPEFYILVVLGFGYSYKYLLEDTKKNKIQKAMGKYLSNEVMQNVVKNIDNIELGGKRADITVLFADIRNFTSISENMDAASTSVILNEYFSAMVPIIEENNGILNKFMGDAVLAIFGEPKRSENHALDAVKCGYQMLKKVKYLQEKWLDEGKPKIEIGIGISSGDAFLGNIGSTERLEYTVIGDTVNTASRIENYNKVYKTNFLISEATYSRVKDYIDAITIKDVTIRGKANKINLYEVIRLIN